jgi:hypothetical protein
VWQKLLPAMNSSSLAPDEVASRKLQQKLQGLTVQLPQGKGEQAKLSEKKYTFPANELKIETVALERDAAGGHDTLVTRIAGVEQRILCGRGKWIDGQAAWGALVQQPAAAAGAWSNGEFTAKICFYETPFIVTVRLKFAGDELTLNSESNVGFGRTKQPEMVGKSQ